MVRVAPSSSSIRAVWLTGALLALAGCATSAPALPTDTTSVDHNSMATIADFDVHDRGMTCDDIAAEWRTTNAALATNNSAIEANRTRNEIAGYFGALYIVPLVATDNNDAQKAKIAELYQRRDVLIRLSGAKHCPDLH